MVFLALILLVAFINLGVCDKCDDSWLDSEYGCYIYIRGEYSWQSAQSICTFYRATLAEIKSEEENLFVTAIARNRSDVCVWLGGSDLLKENDWKWLHSEDDFTSFSSWQKNEPNNQRGDEHCLNIYKRHNYTWNDESCDEKCSFICEQIGERESRGD